MVANCSECQRIPEPVPHPPFGKDVLRSCRVVFDLLSKSFDIDAEAAGIECGFLPPHTGEHARVGQWQFPVSHEKTKQVELQGRKMYVPPGSPEPVLRGIQFQIANLQH